MAQFLSPAAAGNARHPKLHPLVLAVLLCAYGASVAAADEPEDAEPVTVVTVEGQRADDGMVAKRGSTATKTDTPLIETPQSISIVTNERFLDQGAQTVRQTLSYTAGLVAVSFDSRADSVSSRGGSPTQLVDGLQNNFGSYNTTRPDPFMLERVEVLRGPSSVLYGQGSVGGVVNYVQKKPLAQRGGEVQVQVGNRQRRQVAVDVNEVLDDAGHWRARVVAIARDSGSQVEHVPDDRLVFAPSLTWAPDANTELTLTALRQHDESGSLIGFFPWQGTLLASQYGRIPTSTFTGEPGWDAYDTDQTAFGWQLRHRLSDTFELRQNGRKAKGKSDYRSAYTSFTEVKATGRPARPVFNADNRTVNRDLIQQANELDTLLVDTQLEAKFALGRWQHTVLAGVDVQRAEVRQATGRGMAAPLDLYAPVYGNYTVPTSLAHSPTSLLHQKGLYVQEQARFDERWVGVLGWRHDRAENDIEGRPAARTDDRANTGRAGLVYLADDGWAPYVSYAESFLPLGGVDVYGEPYKPQRGRQWEAGVKWQPAGGRVTSALALYELRDTNRKTTDPANPLNSLQMGEVRVRGVELESTGALPRGWNWTAAYTYTDARIARSNGADLGKRVSGIPKHNVSAWLARDFAIAGVGGFTAGGGVRYLGTSWDGTDSLRTPSATLLDAMLSYSTGNWRVAMNVVNLADKVQITTCLARGDCFYGQRRTAMLTARYAW
ncbi:TonB-dependent siderophore receptor [Pseudoduganella plicata]|uniref:Ferrisiderophore receptor n=1 Tax=Pseudoduganella plicata TaxID=321984 RepID=A0A4P7BF35_9BURK|nr:TonB-dependent siderophore receptor [Pseudoduganella plicata]QBQ36597.1 TonB-dependent siderophore receptor [Pseudoduganella plicata]GGY74110.1 ferrisiderophore receptor [Pseudoduganella plicata]